MVGISFRYHSDTFGTDKQATSKFLKLDFAYFIFYFKVWSRKNFLLRVVRNFSTHITFDSYETFLVSAWINEYGLDLIPSLAQHACMYTRASVRREKREREGDAYIRVCIYTRADWQSERALKARRFHVQLAFLIGGAIDATRKGKLCFEGGEGSCFCSSTIEEPREPQPNRQIIRVKRWSFARDRAAIEFQWRTVLNGWLSGMRWNEGIVARDVVSA